MESRSEARTSLKSLKTQVFVLLASRLVSPSVWNPTAAVLRAHGYEVLVSPPGNTLPPGSAQEALDAYAESIPTGRSIVLVAHSNAGNFVPELIAAAPVACVVFVDAVIPVESGPQHLTPASMITQLTPLVDGNGVLPPWHTWFSESEIAALFPDAAVQDLIQSCAPRVPLNFLKGTLQIKPGWINVPCGYVAFGATYAQETARARAHGWPVIELNGRHLHMVVAPDVVARKIVELAQALSDREA